MYSTNFQFSQNTLADIFKIIDDWFSVSVFEKPCNYTKDALFTRNAIWLELKRLGSEACGNYKMITKQQKYYAKEIY